jgi:hypothetical protein
VPYIGKVVSISRENATVYRLTMLVKSDKPQDDPTILTDMEALHLGDMKLEYIAKGDKK